jgi:hypothetical protein
MPYLGEYIGQLLAEITMARMQADFEAVRIAELYAAHPLLRYMPVPHFRVPNIDVDAPVVVEALEVSAVPPATQADIRASFLAIVQEQLSVDKIEFTPEDAAKLDLVLVEKMGLMAWPTEGPVDMIAVSRELSTAATTALTQPAGPIDPLNAPDFEQRLRTTAAFAMLKLLQPLGRLQVGVTTMEVREASTTADVVAHFRLRVTEEGLEWSVGEVDGVQTTRLVIE